MVSSYDRFWPVSFISLLSTRWRGRGPCVCIGGRCRIQDPGASAFAGGSRSDYLQYPAPVDNVQDEFLSAARDLGAPPNALRNWGRKLADIDPFASARIYFYYSETPLVDLAKTSWGCWRGHLGQAGRHLFHGRVGLAPYETPGPISPLLQQENFAIACRVAPGTPKPAPQL